MIQRPQPPAPAKHAVSLAARDSFPSGRTAMTASVVWAVVLALARTPAQRVITGLTGTALVLGVAYTRIYLSMNHPSDIIGALLISTAGILCWLSIWNKLIEPTLRRTLTPAVDLKTCSGKNDGRAVHLRSGCPAPFKRFLQRRQAPWPE